MKKMSVLFICKTHWPGDANDTFSLVKKCLLLSSQNRECKFFTSDTGCKAAYSPTNMVVSSVKSFIIEQENTVKKSERDLALLLSFLQTKGEVRLLMFLHTI
mgnify:CR=1 FL=1